MSKPKLVIYLPGHGGMDKSKVPIYATDPGKMHIYQHGSYCLPPLHDSFVDGDTMYHLFYEGVWNRSVAELCVQKTQAIGISAATIHDPYRDTPLSTRVRVVNAYAKTHNVLLVDIHANAGGGTGVEIFTTRGETKSDKVATTYMENWRIFTDNPMPIRSNWTDGDIDKEANFYTIRNTTCPAVLFEAGFFDNPDDVKILMDEDYQHQVANAWALTCAQHFL